MCHRQSRGWSKLGALAVAFLLSVFFPRGAQGTAVGEMGMQSEAAQSVAGNTARAASFLFTCCSFVGTIIISACMWGKNLTETYSDKIMELAKRNSDPILAICTPCAAQRDKAAQLVLEDFSHTMKFKCSLRRCLLFGESPPKRLPTE